ncbi:hypothetical protein HanHA89_Chr07g0272501 [Helianthus annuus]|nr:hypothetical protein HanHA89_Chr07g0272501 [Helianthus annuus]
MLLCFIVVIWAFEFSDEVVGCSWFMSVSFRSLGFYFCGFFLLNLLLMVIGLVPL